MKTLIPVITMAYFSVTPLMAEEIQPQYFYGAALSQVDMLAAPEQSIVSAKYVPTIFIGMGYQFNLDNDWKLEWNNSLNFSKANITATEIPVPKYSVLTNVGLWSHAKLKYTGLFDHASPFIQAGVGIVNVDYSLNGQSNNTWDTATDLQAGIEFELSEGSTVSIGVGKSKYDKF
ncbi:MAG: outer membrane beta-barrel protein [Paraglaciecola sp.]|uniref:outer membrane beta-barrel protein n=1 Tax=Paraglaciecola sp. TaxID=1920173 RepID=UPI0032977880